MQNYGTETATKSVGVKIGEVASFTPLTKTDPGSDAVKAFRRDGVVCLRGAFGREWLDAIEKEVDTSIRHPTSAADVTKRPGDEGFFFYDTMMWKKNETFKTFVFNSHAADLFKPFLDTEKMFFYYDFLIVKSPRSGSATTPWHHDQSFYPFNGRKLINCWLALDEIPVETSLKFVRGSHKTEHIYRAQHFNPEKTYENLPMDRPLPPNVDAEPEKYEIISAALVPGDTLIFNGRCLHAAPGNHRDTRRAALSTNWLGDDITYNDIPQQMDPPFRGENLVHGGPIECESFPRVR